MSIGDNCGETHTYAINTYSTCIYTVWANLVQTVRIGEVHPVQRPGKETQGRQLSSEHSSFSFFVFCGEDSLELRA